MTDQELRLECLRLAMQDADKFTKEEEIISKAAQFHNFLLNLHEQAITQQHTSQQETKGHCDAIDSVVKQQSIVVALTPELHALLSRLQG